MSKAPATTAHSTTTSASTSSACSSTRSATRSVSEVTAFGKKLYSLVRAKKLTMDEQKIIMERYKKFEIDDVPAKLETDDFADDTARLVRDGKTIEPMGVAQVRDSDEESFPTPSSTPTPHSDSKSIIAPYSDLLTENDFPRYSADFQTTWPTVPLDRQRSLCKPQSNGTASKPREQRVDELIRSLVTFECAFFAQPGPGQRSFDNENNVVVGPFILPEGVKQVDNQEVLDTKFLAEFLMIGRKILMRYKAKYLKK